MSRNVGVFRQNAKIFLSQSQNIFENLAFEEWLLRNYKPDEKSDSMLLWSNKPAVVIGRHQNPWLEADINYLKCNNIELVRRHSGGGAVYHDLGNLNISIMTSLQRHDRKKNLRMVAEALSQKFNIKVQSNDRDDLFLQPGQRKISGTAARIIRQLAYHHLTLLVNVDVAVLKRSLSSPFSEKILTNATRSVKAPAVGYLAQEIPNISIEEVQNVIMESFKKQYLHTDVITVSNIMDDKEFPDMLKYEKELRNWEWIYGRTPQFTLPLYGDELRVEHGVITGSLENQKLIGNRLSEDVIETYLGFGVKPILGFNTTKHLAEMKAYLCEIPEGYDPKLIALNATAVVALFIALIYPFYAYLSRNSVGSEKGQTTT